jgi:hypothetical protein
LKLDADVNTGGGVSTDVAYSITGDRGVNNEGQYRIKTKVSANALILESPLVEDEQPITYSTKRKVASAPLVRDTDYTATATEVTINAGAQYSGFDIIDGIVNITYRALRNDLSANIVEFATLSDLQSFFGIEQITIKPISI